MYQTSEYKESNTVGTAGAHVEDSEIGKYIECFVWEATEQSSLPTRSIEDILGAHLIGDDIWGGTNQSNVSIDTANSKEVMTDSHIIISQNNTYSSFIKGKQCYKQRSKSSSYQ